MPARPQAGNPELWLSTVISGLTVNVLGELSYHFIFRGPNVTQNNEAPFYYKTLTSYTRGLQTSGLYGEILDPCISMTPPTMPENSCSSL